MSCIFCDRSGDVPLRTFYENKKEGWYALLSAPPYTKGHTVLAASNRHGRCPQQFDRRTLDTVGAALSDVVQAIRKHYSVEEVLVVSIRREVKHFHIHLLPVWPKEEKQWRHVTGYPTGHLIEFIGSLEKRRAFMGLHNAAQNAGRVRRAGSTKRLLSEVQALRKRTGYRQKGRKKD